MSQNKQKNIEWSNQQENQLFILHREYGNKWSIISDKIVTKDDNSVKNKFYSTIRKGFRKLNKFITNIKRKKIENQIYYHKLLKPQFLTKLIAIADRNYQEKYQARQLAVKLSQEIQSQLIELTKNDSEYDQNGNNIFEFEEKLFEKILDFNRNCKRRKGKRKQRAEDRRNCFQCSQEQQKSKEHLIIEEKVQKEDKKMINTVKINFQRENNTNKKIQIKKITQKLHKNPPPFDKQQNKSQAKQQKIQYQQIDSHINVSQGFDLVLDDNQFQIGRQSIKTPSALNNSTKFMMEPSPFPSSNTNCYLSAANCLKYFGNNFLKMSQSSLNFNAVPNFNEKNGDQFINFIQKFPQLKNMNKNELFFQSSQLKRQFGQKSYSFVPNFVERSFSTAVSSQKAQRAKLQLQNWIPKIQNDVSLKRQFGNVVQDINEQINMKQNIISVDETANDRNIKSKEQQ